MEQKEVKKIFKISPELDMQLKEAVKMLEITETSFFKVALFDKLKDFTK